MPPKFHGPGLCEQDLCYPHYVSWYFSRTIIVSNETPQQPEKLARVHTPAQDGLELINTERRDAIWDEHIRLRQVLFQEHPLDYLFLEVTRACNLSCVYCGSTCGLKVQRDELSIDQFIDALQPIAADFNPADIMVAVTGGEPLTKPGVLDLFRALQRLGFPYGMVSNGWLLTSEIARELVDAGMVSITLSMDAPPPLNDELRGKGTSMAVWKAVEALHAAGFQGKLEIFTTVTKPAIPLLEQTRAIVSAMRVPFWRVSPVMPLGRAARRPDLVPGPVEIRQILEFVLAARADDYTPAPESCEEGYLGNRFEGNVRPYLCQCRAGVSIAGILCDGRIGACPELGDSFVQGHIHKDRFSDVWRDRYQVFRDRSWMRKGQCAACEHFRRCEGGSIHLYENTESEPHRCLYLLAREGGG
jgi:radical SAM protein with 4Fe4S-binding SPASM domain